MKVSNPLWDYDVLVWMDKGGDMLVSGYTPKGHEALRAISNEYENDGVLHVNCPPDLFMAHMNPNATVGLISEDQKEVHSMSKNCLH